jgi:AraC family transcriptional regulator, regulatory protein of adaptative response / methylated-DNA-[protein]-cysteine methyltransferase
VRALTAKWIETPLGRMVAIADEAGIVLVDFVDRRGLETAIQRVRRRFGDKDHPATIVPGEHPHLVALDRELGEYFAEHRTAFDVPLNPAGTPFERRVWEQLRTIPYGQTRSYSVQAKAIGSPAAVRAVARANGMNYLSIVIPCHRVIGTDGQLVGYGGGLARKRWLLDHERDHVGASA